MRKNILSRITEIAFAICPRVHNDERIRCRHIAFVLNKGRVVSIGWNKAKTHPFNLKYKYYPNCGIHAEIDAILGLDSKDFRKYELAVLRIDNNGKLNHSKPCKFCSEALSALDFRGFYWTDERGHWQHTNKLI